MDLSKAHLYYVSNWHTREGVHFRAQLLMEPMKTTATFFDLPRRILKLSNKEPAVAGNVVISNTSGIMYIASENGPSEFQGNVIYRTLKLIEVTHPQATLTRNVMSEDDITGLRAKDSEVVTHIPVSIEFNRQAQDEMRIPADLVQIISADQLRPGDSVNEYVVENAELQLGIYFCSARRK